MVRYQVELFETSVLLGFGLDRFGMYGFVAVKALVTLTIIGGVYLVIRAYSRIAWLGIMILFGLCAIGIVAGYSNLDYFSFTIGLQSVGLDYKAVFTGISATSIITGCILSFKSGSPAVKKDLQFHEAGLEMMSEDYERYALSKYLH